MTYTPLKKNKPSIVISLILFICAGVCLIFDGLGIGYSLILQLITVITAVAAIFITARYTLSNFTYKLTRFDDIERSPSFAVIKSQGTKNKQVCNLSLLTAIAVVPKAPLKEIEYKYGKITRRFNYCVNMFPEKSYYYIFEFNGSISTIEFESNSDFLATFKFIIGQQ